MFKAIEIRCYFCQRQKTQTTFLGSPEANKTTLTKTVDWRESIGLEIAMRSHVFLLRSHLT